MSKTKYGTFEELLQITEDSQKATAVRLREIVYAVYPEACEVVRLGDRAATDGKNQLRYPLGDAAETYRMREQVGDDAFLAGMRQRIFG